MSVEALGGAYAYADHGGVVCGCMGETSPCKVLSSSLAPPAPVQS